MRNTTYNDQDRKAVAAIVNTMFDNEIFTNGSSNIFPIVRAACQAYPIMTGNVAHTQFTMDDECDIIDLVKNHK